VAIAAPEAIAVAFGGDAQRFCAPLCERCGVLERPRKALRFVAHLAPVVARETDGNERERETENEQHHEHFDEREARAARGARTARRAQRSHDPMSLSMPVPPAWPSAPKLNTSTSPRKPGFRY